MDSITIYDTNINKANINYTYIKKNILEVIIVENNSIIIPVKFKNYNNVHLLFKSPLEYNDKSIKFIDNIFKNIVRLDELEITNYKNNFDLLLLKNITSIKKLYLKFETYYKYSLLSYRYNVYLIYNEKFQNLEIIRIIYFKQLFFPKNLFLKLKKLFLYGNNIIFEEIDYFVGNLECLELTFYNIEFNNILNKITNLNYLYLSSYHKNKINISIPTNILSTVFKLNLFSLNINTKDKIYNNITIIKLCNTIFNNNIFNNYINLEYINIDHIIFNTKINLKRLNNLIQFSLQHCIINSVIDFTNNSELIKIYFNNCNFNDIPLLGLNNNKLIEIKFNYCKITSIEKLYIPISLLHLNLSNNNIESLSNNINLKNVKHLYLRSNKLKNISCDLKNIITLNISNNPIETINNLNFKHLENLYLSNTLITILNIKYKLPNLTLIEMYENNIKYINRCILDSNVKLRY